MNSAPAAPTPPARQEDENALVISFLAVRQALGYLGYLLPLSLLAYAVTAPGRLEPSISDFYYTPMGDILVGILVAIGIFLVTYTGFERKPGEFLSDRWLARIAGAGAIGVALFPVHRVGYCGFDAPGPSCLLFGMTWHRNYLHFGSATLFFLCMAIFCLVQFPKGESVERSRNEPLARYYTYLTCGWLIILGLIGQALPRLIGGAALHASLSRFHYIFWLETLCVLAFATAWLAKGRALTTIGKAVRRVRGG